MSKRLLLVVLLCVAAVAAVGASAAFAGEITGNGKPLWTNTDQWDAEHTLHGESLCAFSGQEDGQFPGDLGNENPEYDPNAPHSQSWGQCVQEFARENGGIPPEVAKTEAGTPGTACNPTADFEE
jgi:hypothetical protein